MNKSYKLAVITSVALAVSFGMPTDAQAGIKISKRGVRISCGDCKKAEQAVKKELRDFDSEVLRPGIKGLGEAGQAVLDGTERLANDINQSIDAMGSHIEKGDIIGGLYEGQKALTNRASDSLAKTMTQSTWLRGGTSIALSAFNPAAGAGFQAWYVREMSGSGSLALKTFAVSLGSSTVLGGIADAPLAAANMGQKALASGVVGGFGTVAHGGHFEHGFTQGAAFSVLTSWHQQSTGMKPFADTASGAPLIKPTDADGNPLYSTDLVTSNWKRPQTGLAWGGKPKDPSLGTYLKFALSEHSPLMQVAAKYVPGVQGGSVWHDVLFHSAPSWAVVATAVPWMGVNYFAVGGRREELLTDQALRSKPRPSPLRDTLEESEG